MTRWRTGNNRRRAKALKQGGLYTLCHGPTWAEEGAGVAKIIDDVTQAIAKAMMIKASAMRPVVTTCPICRRPNPCPLHLFSDQMDHRRAMEARR